MMLKRGLMNETGNGSNRKIDDIVNGKLEYAMGGAQSGAACFVFRERERERDLPLIACSLE
jgi:hypothetical protein